MIHCILIKEEQDVITANDLEDLCLSFRNASIILAVTHDIRRIEEAKYSIQTLQFKLFKMIESFHFIQNPS